MAKKTSKQPDPLKPEAALLIKLGSAVVHAEEFLAPGGHALDKIAFESLLNDPDVQKWLAEMTKMALLPVKRR